MFEGQYLEDVFLLKNHQGYVVNYSENIIQFTNDIEKAKKFYSTKSISKFTNYLLEKFDSFDVFKVVRYKDVK